MVVLAAAIAGAASAVAAVPTQPLPSGPVYRGIPGALPPGFPYVYNALSVGWPVAPRRAQHPIRGAFIDPRGPDDNGLSGYHFGIDINVDDTHPDRGAPTGLSHRIYALDAGVARMPRNVQSRRCLDRRVEVGHFAYWHVAPILAPGQPVRAGQQIAWTCAGVWHVHLSEWQHFGGTRIWVNPLHRGGPLAPYTNGASPTIGPFHFVTPPTTPWHPRKSLSEPDSARPLSAGGLHGQVELRVAIGDPQSFSGFLARNPAWPSVWSPYAVSVEIRSHAGHRLLIQRTTFQADQMPQTPYLVHYAPGTVEDDNMAECVGPPQLPHCDGVTVVRPFSRLHQEFWNTRTFPNGTYDITVTTRDVAGNRTSRVEAVTIHN